MTTSRGRNGADGVLCVGRVYCDLIFTGLEQLPVLGQEQFASGLSIQLGGGAFITASHLASLSRPVSLLATLPSGPFQQTVNTSLLRSGINFEHCKSLNDPNDLQLTVALSMGSERAFVTKRLADALPVKSIDWRVHPSIGHLHIGELTTLVDHPSLVADAHRAGVTVSLDCSWDNAIFERNDLAQLLSGIDIFLPNQAEVEKLQSVVCLEDTVPLTVVKQGDSGAMAFFDGIAMDSPAAAVEVVDTTGAGDAFNAGFIDAWLKGEDIKQCLESGNRCGAKSVATVGGASLVVS